MKVCVVGLGHVGLVTAASLAEMGNDVIGLDTDAALMERLKEGQLPFYEPGLQELVVANAHEDRLRFTTDWDWALGQNPLCIMLAVAADHLAQALQAAAPFLQPSAVLAIRTHVAAGTTLALTNIFQALTDTPVHWVVNPAFLK